LIRLRMPVQAEKTLNHTYCNFSDAIYSNVY
jgi:hypothetical protein